MAAARRHNRPHHLTIKDLGLRGVPVIDSDSQWAFDTGVVHEPETSLLWSDTPQRNVYLAAHCFGYPGTWTRLVFYNLDKVDEGDRVVLKDHEDKAYKYRVTQTFVVDRTDVWVMRQVEGRDMLVLRTCTPIPTFDKRLISRPSGSSAVPPVSGTILSVVSVTREDGDGYAACDH